MTTDDRPSWGDSHHIGVVASAALNQIVEMARVANPHPNGNHVGAGRMLAETIAAGLHGDPMWMPDVPYIATHPHIAVEAARLIAVAAVEVYLSGNDESALTRMHRVHAGSALAPLSNIEIADAMYRDGDEPPNTVVDRYGAFAIGAPHTEPGIIHTALDSTGTAYQIAAVSIRQLADMITERGSERWEAFEAVGHSFDLLALEADSYHRRLVRGADNVYLTSHEMALARLRDKMRSMGREMQSALDDGFDGGPAVAAYVRNLVDGASPMPNVPLRDLPTIKAVFALCSVNEPSAEHLIIDEWSHAHRDSLMARADHTDEIPGDYAKLPLPDLHLLTFHQALSTVHDDEAAHGAAAYRSGCAFIVHALQGLAEVAGGDEGEALRFAARLAARRRLKVVRTWLQ